MNVLRYVNECYMFNVNDYILLYKDILFILLILKDIIILIKIMLYVNDH